MERREHNGGSRDEYCLLVMMWVATSGCSTAEAPRWRGARAIVRTNLWHVGTPAIIDHEGTTIGSMMIAMAAEQPQQQQVSDQRYRMPAPDFQKQFQRDSLRTSVGERMVA